MHLQRYEEAAGLWRTLIKRYEQSTSSTEQVHFAKWKLGTALKELKQFKEAEPLLRETLANTTNRESLVRIGSDLAIVLEGLGRPDEAGAVRARVTNPTSKPAQ